MNRKISTRRLIVALIALAVLAIGVTVILVLTSGKLSYTDDAVDIELIPPATPAN